MSTIDNLSTDKNSVTYAKKPSLSASNHLFTTLAACLGVVAGVFGSMGYVTSSIHNQMAIDTATLSHQMSSYKGFKSAAVFTSGTFDPNNPADVANLCAAPASAAGGAGGGGLGGGGGAGPMTTSAPSGNLPTGGAGGGGGGGAPGGTTNNFVHKLVSGVFSPETATISNTGPDSLNKVIFDNTVNTTVTNTTKLNVSNNNPQSATSGSSTTSENTTGGAATSGDATNTSSTAVNATVTN